MSYPTSDFPDLPPLAHNGWELATWVVLAVAAVAIALVFVLHRGTRQDLKAIRYQTENDHDPDMSNLRHDIDGIRDMVRDDMKDIRDDIGGIRKDIGGLRGELRTEREERIKGDQQRR